MPAMDQEWRAFRSCLRVASLTAVCAKASSKPPTCAPACTRTSTTSWCPCRAAFVLSVLRHSGKAQVHSRSIQPCARVRHVDEQAHQSVGGDSQYLCGHSKLRHAAEIFPSPAPAHSLVLLQCCHTDGWCRLESAQSPQKCQSWRTLSMQGKK